MANKILFLIETDSMTGSGRCALELLTQYKKNKFNNIIIVTQHSNDINVFCKENAIENYSVHFPLTHSKGGNVIGHFIAIFARPFLNFFSLRYLKKHIDFSSITAIHSNTSAIDFGAYLYKKTSIPHIWHFREFSAFNGAFNMIVSNYSDYVNQYSTKIITVSKALGNFLIRNGIPAKKIIPIYDGILKTDESLIQTKFDEKILKLVCVGHIYKQKGQDSIIKALRLLPEEIKNNICCDIYGPWDSTYKKELDSLITKYKLSNIISFKGPVTNAPQILKSYHIGIQPSHAEGFSRVTVEYMQAQLCTIAAKEGAIPELLQNNISGLFYTDYQYDELAQLIKECFYNRNLIKKIGQQARSIAINKFCIENNFSNIIDAYEQARHS